MWIRQGILLAFSAGFVAGENGLNGWLRYASLPEAQRQQATSIPSVIVALNSTTTSPVYVAAQELQAGIEGVLGAKLQVLHEPEVTASSLSVLVGTVAAYTSKYGNRNISSLIADGYWLSVKAGSVIILGQNERGALYGAFDYLSRISQGNFADVDVVSNPDAPIRWVNQWDNLEGTIERGYAGPSIFFSDGLVVKNLTRVSQYARLLASLGINAIVPNNVNANPNLLTAENIEGLGRIADIMRPYGVQVGISLNFASPERLGGLKTFDPLDATVIKWWTEKTEALYKRVPDLAGYLVKANSEGQPGPLTYNRTLADAANLFAKAVQPFGGIVMFRAFVYNHLADWTVWRADRANAAVEFFKHLDGKFLDNVVVQIKYGPIDFQVREPASPLFANIPLTNTAIELQITQEYLGQQSHLVYVGPLWKEILDFDLKVDGKPSAVRDIVAGRRFNKKLGGYAGVVNVGTNTSWLGSHLAMSNLYAYGRLAWNPKQDAQALLQDWIRLSFGHDRSVLDTITKISMESWPAYENYSGNLGIQTLTDILYTHFGPGPASQDNNGWGQWTRATSTHIGMDRTIANGTGNAGQYPPEVAKVYDNIETTPDNLILWFHHVPYTHRLHSGKTVIQHFYDAHYEGAAVAQTFAPAWESLRGKIDAQRFDEVLFRLKYQAGHAIVWRDNICGFYHNLSGIPDEAKRVGNHPWRIQAESMALLGFKPTGVTPAEAASNFTAVATARNGTGEAVATLNFPDGTYDVAIAYYDILGGRAHYGAFINEEPLLEWYGNLEDRLGHAFSEKLDGHSATRVTIKNIDIKKGDVLKIIGLANGNETASLDYVAILPRGIVD
ncbi:glycoside hydrolase superfamily [Lasiosphaeria hispida]|uniref:Alpha-glucuronidase n=1 Tax=Lasiosphaeria hispida TaxID=260671 RepID=A0AAJ0HTD3_9PEZI|nr:glycoside hydrolase superfamily [Lasiosphaeria hispida]